MLNPNTLLDLIRHFIVFEKSKKEDVGGIVTVQTVKKVAGYHQYYEVKRDLESTRRAMGFTNKQNDGGVKEDAASIWSIRSKTTGHRRSQWR